MTFCEKYVEDLNKKVAGPPPSQWNFLDPLKELNIIIVNLFKDLGTSIIEKQNTKWPVVSGTLC